MHDFEHVAMDEGVGKEVALVIFRLSGRVRH